MYQSLHTRVVGDNGEPLEIQIRTREMHMIAEYGIAAHWRYKEGTSDETLIEKIAWLRQLLEWQQESKDADEYLENLRFDLFEDEVFVFTPKGDVMNSTGRRLLILPIISIPISVNSVSAPKSTGGWSR